MRIIPHYSLLVMGALLMAGCPGPDPVDGGPSTDAGHDAGPTPDAGPPPPTECTTGVPGDDAPSFAGLESATSDGPMAVQLAWSEASDDGAPGTIRYLVFQSTDGVFDYASPIARVVGFSTRVEGLEEGTEYRFVVRARDDSDQVECNEVEMRATPAPISGCMDYATDIQPIFVAHCLGCHAGSMPRRDLQLDSLTGVLTGGRSGPVVIPCQPDLSLVHLKTASETPVQGGRMPLRGEALSDANIERLRLWIEQGAGGTCPPAAGVCADTIAPTFAGLTTTTVTGNEVELCWDAASDDTTGASELVYDVFVSHTSGGQELSSWTPSTSAAGATCAMMSGLSPDQEYCWVVRARDAAGNRDTNTVERCETIPSAACIEYATMVQPLFDRECTHCHGGVEPERDLRLESYAEVTSGGAAGFLYTVCEGSTAVIREKVSETPPFGFRMPADGPPYLGTQEQLVLERWIDEGARASCADANPCP